MTDTAGPVQAMQELKPCPRCGGRAFVTIQFGVMCEIDRCLHLPPRSNREEAIAAWNTRAASNGEGADELHALAEKVVDAANIVSHDGYYEADIDRVAQTLARYLSPARQILASLNPSQDGESSTASSVGADALAHLESEARRFAGFYKPNSDMANTLNILGNKIAVLAASSHPASAGGETREALAFIDKFFEPWGSWKTVWWESEVSGDAAFSADNALKHVANILRRALPATHAQEVDETERRDQLAAAYVAGAMDVHNHWLDNPGEAPRGDPEFGEAASDYSRAAISSLAKGGE